MADAVTKALRVRAQAERARRSRQQSGDSTPDLVDCPDPVEFAREYLGLERVWERQAELLRAIAAHDRVAMRSGHKVGKSTSAAVAALWFAKTHADARVVITAPTARQVRIIVWREVKRLYRRAPASLGGVLHDAPDSGLVFPDGREVLGFSTDEPERIAGVSGRHLLFILDEASGVDEQIYEAIEGNRAGGGAKLLLLGNPTKTSGTFYEAFTSRRTGWRLFHVSSEEAAAWQEANGAIPGLASREWVEEKRRDWFPSPLWDVRVAGNFAQQGENAVIGLGLVEAARERWESMPDDGPLELGVDVARFGDDETVIQPVRGKKALAPIALRSLDSLEVAGRVLAVARQLRRAGERPHVKVDVIGYGAGTFDALARSSEVVAVAVNVGEQATAVLEEGQPGYNRLRDQLWFGIRDWLRVGGALPPDGKLEAELVAPTYSFTPTGKVQVESKDKLKERLGRSPDRADALALAAYNPPAVFVGSSDDDWMSDR